MCIPAYNAAAYVPALLESAWRQEIAFDEVLVYDDCSTDNTSEVARAHGATLIRGDVNRGCSFGKNRLARETNCEWIHFHDADDVLLPNFTRLAQAWMREPAAPDVVLFDYEYRDYQTAELISVRRFDDDRLRRDPLAYAIQEQINPFCGLYRTASFLRVGGYDLDPAVLYNEDVAFHIRLAAAGLTFRAEPTVCLVNYRVPGSMSRANQVKCALAHFHVMRRTAERVDRKYHTMVAERLWHNAATAATYSDWETARASVRLAVRLGARRPAKASPSFRLLAGLTPVGAVFAREWAVRLLKPQLRGA